MAAEIEEKLINMKRKLDAAKQQADKAEGALDQLMDQMQKEFGVTSIKEAKAKRLQLEEQATSLVKDIEEIVKELEENYEWH